MSVAGRYGWYASGATLHQWPGIALARAVAGEAPLAEQRPRAGAQRAALVGIEKLGQRLRQRAAHEPPQIGQRRLRYRLAGEVPDDRAQLGLDVKASLTPAGDPLYLWTRGGLTTMPSR